MNLRSLPWLCCWLASTAPTPAPAQESKFPCPDNEIAHYTAYHVREPITIDGKLDEKAWQLAPRSPRFVDILSGKPALHDTRASLLWDDTNLYVAYRVEEPFVHATYTTNNSPIYYDNDVEMFIAGQDSYYEFEINAYNTTYEVFFIWQDAYEKGGFSRAPEFQRSLLQPFNGVDFTNHPRGLRLGNFNWHFPGKQTAVFIDGTVNQDSDRDRGWTVELAFPWKGMAWLARADHRSSRPVTAMSGAWISPASTPTRKPPRPATPAAGSGAVTAFGTPTSRNASPTSASPPMTSPAREIRNSVTAHFKTSQPGSNQNRPL